MFIGVGGFEKEVVQNIDSFVTYLNSKHLKDFEIASAITPDAGHGAALGAVMQNAIAFGYCDKRKSIAIDPGLFKNYTAHYVYYENNDVVEEVDILQKDGKLYAKWGNAADDELRAISTTEFYTPSNEKMVYRFTSQNELILNIGSKTYRLVRKN